MRSCRLLQLVPPYQPAEIEGFIKEIIAANDFKTDIAVRLTIFGDGEGTWASTEPVSMFIAPMEKKRTDLTQIPLYKACITTWQRINDNVLPPRAKVGANYINSRLAYLEAKRNGYDFPIFLGIDGKVAESSGACLFMVRDGKLVTPTTTSSILESITRDTLIKLAKEMGYDVVERSIDRTELYVADEVFLCGSAIEVAPIVSVDGYIIGSGQAGVVTTELLRQYLAVASGVDLRHPEWRTVVYRAALEN
jgi:branched-chain amino acid aminotransferase